MDHDVASRIVNAWLGGDPSETVCSRVYRWRWLVPILWLALDLEAHRRWDEPWGHCRRAHANHRARRRSLPEEPDQRLRRSQEA